MSEQLPAIIDRTGIIRNVRAHIVPSLIAAARASLRFLVCLPQRCRRHT